jgi:hypothetical protein
LREYKNKEKDKLFIIVLPIEIRLRVDNAGDTCGIMMNPKIKTDMKIPGGKDITCRAEQMFNRPDAGME